MIGVRFFFPKGRSGETDLLSAANIHFFFKGKRRLRKINRIRFNIIILYMFNVKTKIVLKNVLSGIVIALLGACTLVFGFLYLEDAGIAFLEKHKKTIEILLSVIVSVCVVVSYVLSLADKNFIYKITVLVLALASAALLGLYILKITGFMDKIDSIEDLRAFVASYGHFTVPIFIVLQFLQVIVLPIPGFITIGAGVALFGPFYGSVFSLIGILSASFVAFWIGRHLGYRVASWLVGKESLDKALALVKGKDRVVLTFMFIFPFFPDDVLCFVAGLSSMSPKYYAVMISLTRLFSVVFSAYSFNGSLIPYNTWWGIAIWAVIFLLTATLCVFIYKKGDRIEKWVRKKIRERRRRSRDKQGKN